MLGMVVSFWLLFLLTLQLVAVSTPLILSAEKINSHHRRILHHPFFSNDSLPPTGQPPESQPPAQQQQPKQPFSTLSSPTNQGNPFFPAFPTPPPPPPTTTSVPTFPANISSIILPRSSSSSKPISRKLVVVAVTLSVGSAVLVTAIAAFLIHHRRHSGGHNGKLSRAESLRLFPPNTDPSDGARKSSRNVNASGGTSSEFLYPGTARGIDDEEQREPNPSNPSASSMPGYQKLGSPELRPLPPLPRHNYQQSGPQVVSVRNAEGEDHNEDGDEEFFSPRATSSGKCSPETVPGTEDLNFCSRISDSRTASYPSSHYSVSPTNSMSSCSPFVPLHLSPRSLRSKSPDSVVDFPPPSRPPPAIPPPTIDRFPTQGSASTAPTRLPPPPPPPPPPRFWETPAVPVAIQVQMSGPPTHVAPTRPPLVLQDLSTVDEAAGEGSKPKLKPLHWDKVRASSDRAMVWDQLKSSSFQLNEEMIETLFVVNSSSSHLGPKDNSSWRSVPQIPNQENRVLDPKKSQNIAILLRALNVTIEEVCEALLEGSADTLGTELLESLLKMAPTKEEERKLKEFNDESPFKLGPAEKFLKAVLDIPFAFQRVEAMLYIANFDSEADYLKRSFETLEVACEELRSNRMFLKLLEAVLKTGNRMNVGTNRGDAEAFKLDTLLKLVDIKGTDGKTTLLHFVVQEISRAEGSRLANADYNDHSSFQEDLEFRKQGLQVVSGLSSELTNVKKAAAMDSETLSSDVSKLSRGLVKIREVLKSTAGRGGNSQKFSESMIEFLKKAEAEIVKVEGKERVSVSLVKEITEYFHGNSAKEEAHPFRIFMVVRDFISVLDRVCKEVGKINERSLVSSTPQFPPTLVNSSTQLLPVFPELNMKQQFSSSDDESSSSSS